MNKYKSLLIIVLMLTITHESWSQKKDVAIGAKENKKSDGDEPKEDLVETGNAWLDSALVVMQGEDKKYAKRLFKYAIKDYSKALELKNTSFTLYYNLAIAQTQLKKYEDAVENFSKAIEQDSSSANAYRERAMAYKGLKKFDLVVSNLDTAIDLNYDDAAAFYQRAIIRETGRAYQPPLDDYNRAIELEPEFEEAYFKRGVLYHNKVQDFVRAKLDMEKVLQLNTENAEAYFWLGKINFSAGDFSTSNQFLTQHLEFDSLRVDALLMRGASRTNLKMYTDAIEDFTLVIELDKKNVFAYMNRGLAKGGLRLFDEALLDLDKAAELKFDFSSIYVNRALIKFHIGDRDGACKDLKKAQSLNNTKADELLDEYCLF